MSMESDEIQREDCARMLDGLHLDGHVQEFRRQLDEIEMNGDSFRDTFNEQKNDLKNHLSIKQIDQWELDSIKTIRQTAKECREMIVQQINERCSEIELNLRKLTDLISEVRHDHTSDEADLAQLKQQVAQLKKDFDQLPNLSIQQDSTALINRISLVASSKQMLSTSAFRIDRKTKWKPNGLTVAGGNGKGRESNQLNCPFGLCVDDENQCIYIADCGNRRLMQWDYDAKRGQILAEGSSVYLQVMNQPIDVIIDKRSGYLIVSDWGNKKVTAFRRRNGSTTSAAAANVLDMDSYGITMDNNGALYVSDCKNHLVRRCSRGEKEGVIVAGGNSEGDQFNQLNFPTHLFVDEEFSLYISDNNNHRVMKWLKDAKEGTVVAGGHGQGKSLTQLSYPQGVMVDHMGNVYVVDSGNHRIVRWSRGCKEGQIIIGGNGKGHEANQFSGADGISFDRQGNIYVVDSDNHRVQKFEIDLSFRF